MVKVCAGDKTAPLQMFDDKSCLSKERLFLFKRKVISFGLAQSPFSTIHLRRPRESC